MDWIDIKNEKPNAGNFETVDVWVCCGSTTYAASWIKHRDDKEGRFYLDLNYPKRIFEDITSHVTHWQYTVYPWEGKPETTSENSLHKHIVINWAYFPEEKPNYGDEILLQYPPEQCRTMPKITTIYDRDTELIDGCKWALITPCL